MSRREERRKERRADIETEALAMVREGGLEALTMPALAKRLGAAVGALYRYYEGKEALMLHLQLRAVDAFDAVLIEHLQANKSEPPLERLRGAMRSWGEFTQSEPSLYELLQVSIAHPKVLLDDTKAAEVAARSQPLIHRCVTLLDEAVAAGELTEGDNEARVWMLWGTTSGLGQLRKQDRRREPHLSADRLLEQALDAMLSGWAPSR